MSGHGHSHGDEQGRRACNKRRLFAEISWSERGVQRSLRGRGQGGILKPVLPPVNSSILTRPHGGRVAYTSCRHPESVVEM